MSTHSTYNLETKLRTFPWFYIVPQIKICGESVQGFMSYDQTSKPTNSIKAWFGSYQFTIKCQKKNINLTKT